MARTITQRHFESCGLFDAPEDTDVMIFKDYKSACCHIYEKIFNWTLEYIVPNIDNDGEAKAKIDFQSMRDLVKQLIFTLSFNGIQPWVFTDTYGHFVNKPFTFFEGMNVDSDVMIIYYTDDICEKISICCTWDKGHDIYACAINDTSYRISNS